MRLTTKFVKQVSAKEDNYKISPKAVQTVDKSHEFLKQFSKDKVIYGINTGFGPMVEYRIDKKKLEALQYNLLRSHSSGTGEVLTEEECRSVLVCRLHSLALGYSGISSNVIMKMQELLDKEVYPEVFAHGGVGASGDLVQLAHVGLGLIGEGYSYYDGKRGKTVDIYKKLDIDPLKLQLRDALAIMNGTSAMSGQACLNIERAELLIEWGIFCSALLLELAESFDDSFSKELNQAKQHSGQQEVASNLRNLLTGSRLVRSRIDSDYQTPRVGSGKVFSGKVQENYSVRCVPQIIGPILDSIKFSKKVVEDEINSANDNPIVDVESEQVYHGGNFHGDCISLEMDKVRIVMTKLSMLHERQLNYLLNSNVNKKFPAFLNDQIPGLNFGLQGAQFTATSTTAENQTLSSSMYVHSISCNNDNQDIVSMGMNSARLTSRVLDNAFQVQSIALMGLMQAVMVSGAEDDIAPAIKSTYDELQKNFKKVEEDRPLFEDIENINTFIRNNRPKKQR